MTEKARTPETGPTHVLASDPWDEDALTAFATAIGRIGPQDGGPWTFFDAEQRGEQMIQIWRSPRGGEVVLTDDFESGLRFLNLYRLTPEAEEALLAAVAGATPFADRRDLLRRAGEGDGQALFALGLIGGPPDAEALRLIAEALDDADGDRRRVAAEAAALARWPALGPALERAAATERDPDLKRLIEYAALRCR